MPNEREYSAAIYAYIPFGPVRTKLLISYFKSAQKVWKSSAGELMELGLNRKIVSGFVYHRENFNFDKYFGLLKKLSIDFVTIKDKKYPKNLKRVDNAPYVLYLKGKFWKEDENIVAIVGSRKMTSYGREIAEMLSTDLSNFGVTTVSGLARGIDTIVHSATINSGGRTIAVLGCGLDIVYPPENYKLARNIIEKGGVIVSEYPLGHPPLRINFANRNRIISGLSRAVVVIEGAKKSGTLLTASHAAEQGVQVFAVPGQITSPLSYAPHFLIKNGANILFSAQDVIEELNLQFKVDKKKVEKVMPGDEIEKKIAEAMENEELYLDEIARMTGLQIADVSAKLTVMEMKGIVKNMGNGIYRRI